MDRKEYLKPDFNPKNLKVAQLRRILMENYIDFPNSSKKSVLVKLFEKDIKSNYEELREKYKLPEIQDMDTSYSSSRDSDVDVERSQTQEIDTTEEIKGGGNELEKKTKSKSKSKSKSESSAIEKAVSKKRKYTEDSYIDEQETTSDKVEKTEKLTPPPPVSKKRKNRASKDGNITANTSLIAEKVSKKSPVKSPNKSLIIDKFEVSDSSSDSFIANSTILNDLGDTSSKTGNNDFTYKKRTLAPDLDKLKASSEFSKQLKNLMEGNQEKIKETEIKKDKEADLKNEEVEPIEEEPENVEKTVEVEAEAITNNTHSTIRCFSKIFCQFLLFITFMVPIFFGLWYREQKVLIGYCGQELPMRSIIPSNLAEVYPALENVDNWLANYKPECIPCPKNVICYSKLGMKCKPEYNLITNKLNLYGLLPLSNTCEKNGKREKLVAEVVKKTLDFLRTKSAQIDCGDGKDDLISGITENELFEIFHEVRAPWISDNEFEDLWEQVIVNLKNEKEISWRQLQLTDSKFERETNNIKGSNDFQGKKGHILQTNRKERNRIFRSTSKKYIGLRCQFEREVYQTYLQYKFIVWIFFSLIIIFKATEYKLKKYFEEKVKIEQLTKDVIENLKKNKRQSQNNLSVPVYASTVQLRDVLLYDVVDLKQKNFLWQQVVKILENNNTNIKSSLLEVHGEIMKCWEWIGSVDFDDINDNEQITTKLTDNNVSIAP